jgi:sporulation protein YlmC with PRC-barrel domain
MLRGISDVKRFAIAATDGNLGSVSDLYFDDRTWAVRYLVVDAGPWLPGRRLFVPPISVRSSDAATLRLGLSMRQVEMSSVSSAQLGGVLPEDLARAGAGADCHLQTATTVMGYAIRAEDGEIGHVKDVLVDDKAWAIRYLAVDTEHWWAGRTVLVSPRWFTRVTWDESKTLFCLVTAAGDAGFACDPVRRHASALRTAPGKMYNQGDDRDDEENVNQASRHVECDPTKDPCDKKDDR